MFLPGDAPARPVAPPPPPPRSDIASSGANYGIPQANAYKATPQYKQAVTSIYDHQPPPQKQAIVAGALKNPTAEGKIVLDHVRQSDPLVARNWNRISPQQLVQHVGKQSPAITLGGIGHAISTVIRSDVGANGTSKGGSNVGSALAPILPIRAGVDVAKAIYEKPAVIPATLKGGAELAAGLVAAPVQLALNPGQIPKIPGQIVKDLATRYGPLLAGNDQAFIDQIKNNPEGIAPELTDAFLAAGGLDATVGRATAAAGRKAEVPFFTAERPNLLLSGSKTRPQQLGNTAGRIAAQRLEDKLRTIKQKQRPGELTPAVGQIAPLFEKHAIRVTHSGIAQAGRRFVQENLSREVRGRPGSAASTGAKLSGLQRKFASIVAEGHIPLDQGAEAARTAIEQRMQQIREHRAANPTSPGNHIPAQYASKIDELGLLRELHQNAEQVFKPNLAAWQKAEAARAQRIDTLSGLDPLTAEARRLRPQGEAFGIPHPDDRLAQAEASATAARAMSGENLPARPFATALGEARSQQKLGALAAKPYDQLQREYIDQVRAARAKATEKGGPRLPEPAYVAHQPHPRTDFSAYASGSGAKAMAAPKRSQFTLYKAGAMDRSYQAYMDGLARSLKRPVQWRTTDEQFRAAYLGNPSRTAIRAGLGYDKHPTDLTLHEQRKVLAHSGVDMKNVMFVNPGRLAKATQAEHDMLKGAGKGAFTAEHHDMQANADLHEALSRPDIAIAGDHPKLSDYAITTGWKAVPKTAFDEIHGGLKASSTGGRIAGKIQGTTAGLILGQNPSFVAMNTLAHAFPAIAGTKGAGLVSMAKFPMWWHGLTDAERDTVRAHAGGRGGHYASTARLGSQAPNQIAAGWRQLQERGIVQAAQHVNPFHALLKAEDLQSNFFRHAVFYHELKTQAFRDMGQEFGTAVKLQQQLQHTFTLGPQDRMRQMLKDMPTVEALGRTTVNILGDYGRFTNRERTFLNNRAVLFYSFLRHVTRTLFYVLPARHPLALAMLGELSQLHHEEVDKLLGGKALPWSYSRVFWDHNGHLTSIDFGRTSPVTSPIMDVLAQGPKALGGMIAPALQPLLEQIFGVNTSGVKVPANVFSALNSYASLSYPYRAFSMGHFGLQAQKPDSIPYLHEDPVVLKSAAAQAYAQAKQQARGPLKDQMLGGLLGLYPKPDDSRVIAEHRAAAAAKKSGGSGWSFGGSSGASSGGGWNFGGASSSSSGGWSFQ